MKSVRGRGQGKASIRKLSAVAGFFLLTACSHHITLDPNIQPNAFTNEEYPQTAGVMFSPEMKNYVEHARPSSHTGSAHTYNFEMGSTLVEALTRAVDVAYRDVVIVSSQEEAQGLERLIRFSLANSNMDIRFDSGGFSSSAEARYTISVTAEGYGGGDLQLVRRSTVSGNGFSGRGNTSAFNADEALSAAVEGGIQQLADNVANILISGFAEPGQ